MNAEQTTAVIESLEAQIAGMRDEIARLRAQLAGPHPYQIIGVYGTGLRSLRTLWARDDDHAREQAGELAPGVCLFRDVERASPGKGGRV